jgi:hypothetical protein
MFEDGMLRVTLKGIRVYFFVVGRPYMCFELLALSDGVLN